MPTLNWLIFFVIILVAIAYVMAMIKAGENIWAAIGGVLLMVFSILSLFLLPGGSDNGVPPPPTPVLVQTPPPTPIQTPVPTLEPTPTLEPSPTPTPFPTPSYISLHSLTNIATGRLEVPSWTVTDNYGNEYDNALLASSFTFSSDACSYTVLLGENFSRFQADFFIRYGETSNRIARLEIILDYDEIYTVSIRNTDRPVPIDICVYGGNVFTLRILGSADFGGWGITSGIGNAVFLL